MISCLFVWNYQRSAIRSSPPSQGSLSTLRADHLHSTSGIVDSVERIACSFTPCAVERSTAFSPDSNWTTISAAGKWSTWKSDRPCCTDSAHMKTSDGYRTEICWRQLAARGFPPRDRYRCIVVQGLISGSWGCPSFWLSSLTTFADPKSSCSWSCSSSSRILSRSSPLSPGTRHLPAFVPYNRWCFVASLWKRAV